MIVVVIPAQPKTPVENLDFLAQDALDMTREVVAEEKAPGFGDLLAEAGFGETTRGAVPLGGSASEDTGPAPMILQMEVRTQPAD